jgi:FlaA1/EpsC-like NDP-sugar epimerase
MFKDKTVLITGGTGSLGRAILSRMISMKNPPKKIIIFSRDEYKQHQLRLLYESQTCATDEVIYNNFNRRVVFQIGDIRDYHSVSQVLKGVDIVFHAAAMKQVPVAEYSPYEVIKTNIIGAENIIAAIQENNLPIESVIGISTDKACMPISAYGMTKAIMERVFIAANIRVPDTRFVLCRYGNVMNSSGSVIPLFKELILHDQDIMITHPEMTRFMINLNEAVDTVIEAYKGAYAGEIYIPVIKSAKILDVAKVMIGDRKVNIVEGKIRPGEKLYELLISPEEMLRTVRRGKYCVITPQLPELHNKLWKFVKCSPPQFSSNDYVMNMDEVKVVLEANKLLL